MSMRSKLTFAAMAGLVAMSALTTTSASAFSLRACEETASKLGCGSTFIYTEQGRTKREPTPPRHARTSIPAPKPCLTQAAAVVAAAAVVVVAAGKLH